MKLAAGKTEIEKWGDPRIEQRQRGRAHMYARFQQVFGELFTYSLQEIVSGDRGERVNRIPTVMEFVVCLEKAGSEQIKTELQVQLNQEENKQIVVID